MPALLRRYPILCGVASLLVLLALAALIRVGDFKGPVGAQNLEATYHVLLTIKALGASPASDHWLLPTVTLGKESDHFIPWGATIPTSTGSYVYTSFMPSGFLTPFFIFKVLGVEATQLNLALFNVLCGALSAIVLFVLLYQLLVYSGRDAGLAALAAALGCLVAVFSREVLQSHGVTYWSHSLYQPILASSIYALFKYISADKPTLGRASVVLLFAVLGPLVEWTAFVFNVGTALMLWFRPPAGRDERRLAVGIVLATGVAGALSVLHFVLAAGIWPTLIAMVRRFLARDASSARLSDLFSGYGLSYGMFLVLVAGILLASFFARSERAPAPTRHPAAAEVTVWVSMLTLLPLVENLLMMQHAAQFSFDRLKFIFPAAFVIAFGFVRSPAYARIAIAVVVAVACVQGVLVYRSDIARHAPWIQADAANRVLAAKIAEQVDPSCAVFASSAQVRAYANLLFDRGIHEYRKLEDMPALVAARGGCAGVFLEGPMQFVDLPRYERATIVRGSGERTVIEAPRVE